MYCAILKDDDDAPDRLWLGRQLWESGGESGGQQNSKSNYFLVRVRAWKFGLARRVWQSRPASACSSPSSGWIGCLLTGFLPSSEAASIFFLNHYTPSAESPPAQGQWTSRKLYSLVSSNSALSIRILSSRGALGRSYRSRVYFRKLHHTLRMRPSTSMDRSALWWTFPPRYTNSFVWLYIWPAASTLNMAVDSSIPFAR